MSDIALFEKNIRLAMKNMGWGFWKYLDEDVVDEFLRSPLGYGVYL